MKWQKLKKLLNLVILQKLKDWKNYLKKEKFRIKKSKMKYSNYIKNPSQATLNHIPEKEDKKYSQAKQILLQLELIIQYLLNFLGELT